MAVGDGFGKDVDLDVVSVAVESGTMAAYGVAKGKHAEKGNVPSIKPWWTPWDSGAVEEVQLLIRMSCCLSGRSGRCRGRIQGGREERNG